MACLTCTQDIVFALAKDQKTNWFMVVELVGSACFEYVHKPSTLTNLKKCVTIMDWKNIQSFI